MAAPAYHFKFHTNVDFESHFELLHFLSILQMAVKFAISPVQVLTSLSNQKIF